MTATTPNRPHVLDVRDCGYDEVNEEPWASVLVDERWVVDVRFTRIDRVEPVEVTLYAEDVGSRMTLTTRVIRDIPWGSIFTTAMGALARLDKFVDDRGDDRRPVPSALRQDLSSPRRPGPRRRSDEWYTALAALYVLWLARTAPVPALAQALLVSPHTVRNGLHEARRRELLISAGRGRAGGELTAKALSVLADADAGPADEADLLRLARTADGAS